VNDRRRGLENWYRRLLVAYPAGHRRQYGQEMLGVMLADANERGQRRPSLRESLDLLSGGLKIRARRRPTLSFRTPSWRDALAVVSLIGPLILLANTAMTLNMITAELIPEPYPRSFPWGEFALDAPRWLGWPVVLALAFWGGPFIRRCAKLAAAALAIDAVYQQSLFVGRSGFEATAAGSGFVMLYLVAAVALAASPGTRHGLTVLGRVGGRLMLTAAATGFFCEVFAPVENAWDLNHWNSMNPWYSWRGDSS
jgi:hypothetical protein